MLWFYGKINLHNRNIEIENKRLSREILNDMDFKEMHVGNLYVQTFCSTRNEHYFYTNDRYVIFGEAHIHNKMNLVQSKILLHKDIENKSDLEIFLFLYEKSKDNYLDWIVGEFGVVIYDKYSKETYLIRDHIGIKTLFYIRNDVYLYVASDIDLLQHLFSLSNIDTNYFVEFMQTDGVADSEKTPYKSVARVPSASYVTVSESKLVQVQYWNVKHKFNQSLTDLRLEDYVELFREIMIESTQCRLGPNRNAVMMSGGLDSTTIYALSKKLDLPQTDIVPICGVFEKYSECDERKYIIPILEDYHDQAIFEICDEHYLLKGFPYDSPWTFEPNVNSLTYSFTSSLLNRAKENNIRTVLTGYAGDHVLTGTHNVIKDLFRKGNLKQAIEQTKIYGQSNRLSVPGIMWRKGVLSYFSLKHYESLSWNQMHFCKQLFGTKARIYLDRVIAGRLSIDTRHPFLDRRLIEFVYSIPGTLCWNKGTTKFILRESMKDLLPNSVIQRKDKTGHVPLFYKGIRENWSKLSEVLFASRLSQLKLISRKEWENELIRWRQGASTREDFWTLLSIELWLYKWERKATISAPRILQQGG
ncbi:asparagine synthase-related protein [Paenibacillus sp. p3-SID867]|uniref:asparagine synthase-related protein n=1 Tax=Paenibacillus sp. p3-SID867 TaxID=2916363 RepID=UPI0021A8EC86|nr:asparagine synthase-related protein [Paenibacillus sp. p3-SID867]MCT1403813.1 asparagine synthase-related protein [Paenibacillus sp. p3-SID867]